MTKYLVALIIIVAAGGAFIFSQTQTQSVEQAPVEDANPFGEGAETVGSLSDDDEYEDADKDGPEGSDDDAVTPGTGTTQGTTGTDSGTTAGTISRTELAKHSTQSDCWIGYKGVVYDITNWLPRHPGSAGAIAPFCGKADEFAAAFNKKHGTRQEGRLEKEGVKEGVLGN